MLAISVSVQVWGQIYIGYIGIYKTEMAAELLVFLLSKYIGISKIQGFNNYLYWLDPYLTLWVTLVKQARCDKIQLWASQQVLEGWKSPSLKPNYDI